MQKLQVTVVAAVKCAILICCQNFLCRGSLIDRQSPKAVPSGEKAAPAGVEVKVKIPAAPKAPKVTIDYAKGTFKLPKNAEAQIIFNEPDTTTRAAGELKSTPWKDLSITTGDQALILAS